VIPVKSISSVTTQKDGLRFTKVSIICSGNTIDFRVGHDEARRVKELITALVLGSHQAQQVPGMVSPTTTEAVAPDVMSQIRRLGELKEAGLVTEEEFAAKKAELLNRL